MRPCLTSLEVLIAYSITSKILTMQELTFVYNPGTIISSLERPTSVCLSGVTTLRLNLFPVLATNHVFNLSFGINGWASFIVIPRTYGHGLWLQWLKQSKCHSLFQNNTFLLLVRSSLQMRRGPFDCDLCKEASIRRSLIFSRHKNHFKQEMP